MKFKWIPQTDTPTRPALYADLGKLGSATCIESQDNDGRPIEWVVYLNGIQVGNFSRIAPVMKTADGILTERITEQLAAFK